MLSKPTILGLVSLSALPILLIVFERLKHKNTRRRKRKDSYNYRCIFVTEGNRSCVQHLFKSISCGKTCSYTYLRILQQILRSAEFTISLCVYHITLDTIRDELIAARNRSVMVRIITDREMINSSGSKITELIKAGVEVKTQNKKETSGFLHHKFCVVDAYTYKKIMWFGSLNLTLQGFCLNWENVVITDNKEVISRFGESFENLWSYL